MGGIVNTISKAVKGATKSFFSPISSFADILNGNGTIGDLVSIGSLFAPGGNFAKLSFQSIGDASFKSIGGAYLKQLGIDSPISGLNPADYQQILSGGRNLFGGNAGLNAMGQFIAPGASPFGLGGIGGVSGFGTGFGTGYPSTGATLTGPQRELARQDLQRFLALRARAAAANDPRNFGTIADRFRSKLLTAATGTGMIEGSRLEQTTNDPHAAASLRLKLLNDATRQANDFQRDLFSPQSVTDALQRQMQLFGPAGSVSMFENFNRATGNLTQEQKRIRQAIRDQMERARLMQLFGLATN